MKWRLYGACSINIKAVGVGGAEIIVKMSLVSAFIERVGVGLGMLKEGLIESMELVGDEASYILRLNRLKHDIPTSIQFDHNMIILCLDEIEFDRWLHFILRTIRDGVAEIDHIDLDAPIANKRNVIASIIVSFPTSLPPVTSDQARRRLGL